MSVDGHRHRHELQRESAVMILYVSIVLLATLAALPADYGDAAEAARSDDLSLVAVVWGTAIGLALAHWFAFVVESKDVEACATCNSVDRQAADECITLRG